MMSSPAVYAWSMLMLEMYFVACPACISFMLIALILGRGNKERALFANSEQDLVGMTVGMMISQT
ncbi:hypothetical protein RYX36_030710, partial [Vicia faba]